jgi:hypothetical protein
MPNDNETKKRWRIATWGGEEQRLAAEKIEAQLNLLAADNYEIYEVNYEQQLVIGRHDAPVEQPASGILQFLGQLTPMRPTPNGDGAVPEQPQPEDSSVYTIQGQQTRNLLNGLHAIVMVNSFGDMNGEQRLNKMIQDLFGRAPRIEIEHTIEDVKVFHKKHTEDNCNDPNCLMAQLMERARQKLEAQLVEKPLS